MKDVIMIIDDDDDMRDFLTGFLSRDYIIICAADGKEALGLLEKQYVSLIVSDVMMPRIDGYELCDKIKSDLAWCHIPLLLLTAKTTLQSKIKGLELGADAYVEKPFSPEFLLVQITNLLKNRIKIKEHFARAPFEYTKTITYSHNDEQFLNTLHDFILSHIDDQFIDIDRVASFMNMSRATFFRKVKGLCSLSPKDLINIIRLKKAAGLIIENNYTINEIARLVGFYSQSTFSKNFLRHYGIQPSRFLEITMNKQGVDHVGFQ